jgi:hypothetical protein
MAAFHAQLEFWTGDAWPITASCFQADGVTPLDLTGATVTWELLADDSDVVLLTLTSNDAITILSPPTAGNVLITVNATQSGNIPAGFYHDRVRVVLAGGAPTTQAEGPIAVFS